MVSPGRSKYKFVKTLKVELQLKLLFCKCYHFTKDWPINPKKMLRYLFNVKRLPYLSLIILKK